MFAIVDARAPQKAIDKLLNYVSDILLFNSKNITYNSISGHPDIFIYQDTNELIIAPNSPKILFDFFHSQNIRYKMGTTPIGTTSSDSVLYNCLSSEKYFFHKRNHTDERIIQAVKNKTKVFLPQAYTRCSMINIDANNYVTSDKGIEKILINKGFNTFYFSPDKIQIQDHKNGFIGGTSGMYNDKIFFLGNILFHNDGEQLQKFLNNLNVEIVNLNDDYLYDGGSIIFV